MVEKAFIVEVPFPQHTPASQLLTDAGRKTWERFALQENVIQRDLWVMMWLCSDIAEMCQAAGGHYAGSRWLQGSYLLHAFVLDTQAKTALTKIRLAANDLMPFIGNRYLIRDMYIDIDRFRQIESIYKEIIGGMQ